MNRTSGIILTTVAVIVCIVEAFTKGWYSFFAIPALLIVVPLILVGRAIAARRPGSAVPIIWLLFVLASILAYVFTPGFGDTDDILLFGFYVTKIGPLGDFCQVVAALASFAAAILSVMLLVSFFIRRPRRA